jgi:hypothetical protein
MTDREIISTLASMNPLKPCHHLPTPSKAPSQPCSTLLPQNRQRNTRPPEVPPHTGGEAPRRRAQEASRHARQRKTPVMTGSGVQNTCHTFQS